MKKISGVIALAVTATALLTTLTSCSGKKEAGNGKKSAEKEVIRVSGSFRGEEEARFNEIVKIFNEKSDYTVVYTGSPEFETEIHIQVEAGTPPDIAALPQPGLMKDFAAKGKIKALSSSVVNSIDSNYAPVWKDLGSYNGKVYGVFHRVNAKSFVWYNKPYWESKGYSIPKTWAELKALEEQMVANGDTPWSIGFESAAASGWPGTDWLENMVLRTAGPDVYDKWVNHEIAFDDPAIQKALNVCGEIFLNEKYVYGGSKYILSQNYGTAIQPIYEPKPKAMMNLQGNFITGFMQEEVQKNLETQVGVFALPSYDEAYGTPVLGGGDQFVKLTDKPGVDEFLTFLTTWEACAPWARIGGALFPHKNQNLNDYGNSLERDIAQILVNASVFRFDASDLMPAEVGSGTFWTGMLNYVSGDTDVAKTLKTIDASWPAK